MWHWDSPFYGSLKNYFKNWTQIILNFFIFPNNWIFFKKLVFHRNNWFSKSLWTFPFFSLATKECNVQQGRDKYSKNRNTSQLLLGETTNKNSTQFSSNLFKIYWENLSNSRHQDSYNVKLQASQRLYTGLKLCRAWLKGVPESLS